MCYTLSGRVVDSLACGNLSMKGLAGRANVPKAMVDVKKLGVAHCYTRQQLMEK